VGNALPKMTAEAFLDWEAHNTSRHEFVRGEVFAMAGAEAKHNIVAGNLYAALRAHLRGSACQTFISDMKLRVEAVDAFFYPDVMVSCSERDQGSPQIKAEPGLVVEVLSRSTEAHDRGGKFAAYRTLPSLREYLLVDVDARRCDLFRKNDAGEWVLHPLEGDQTLELSSVGLTIPARDLWADL
jgi:Uma2 family endonuclease